MPVSEAQAREIFLSFPEAEEKSHFGTPDFRVRNKIFATLHSAGGKAVLMLSREEQLLLMETQAKAFAPVPGGWGLKGATHVTLKAASAAGLRAAATLAYVRKAPKALAQRISASGL